MQPDTYTKIPRLRPFAQQGKDYWRELRVIHKDIRYALKAEAEQRIRENGGDILHIKWTLTDWCYLALRWRLNLKAVAELIEEEGVLPAGFYEKQVMGRKLRPMTLLREYIEQYGVPDAAPGCEVGNATTH